ncbi:MAG: hypothetical protein AAF402_08815 [Pseudomonadota bacterium]
MTRIKARYSVPLVTGFLLLVLTLLGTPFAVHAGSIAGTLTLPSGAYSLPSDMQMFVSARATVGSPTSHSRQTLITFDAASLPGSGETFLITGLLNDHDYTLSYSCTGFTFPLPCRDFVPRLNFNDSAVNDTVLRREDGQVFDGAADTTGIAIPIQIGTAYSGTIFIPGGENAAGDISFTVLARNVNTPQTVLLQTSHTIAQGTNSIEIEIHVPDDDSESWHIGYACVSALDPDCGVFQREGYTKDGATNNTVEETDDADVFVGDTPDSTLNFAFLTGFRISGTVFTPEAVEDAAGILLTIRAQDTTDSTNFSSTPVTISQGSDQESYELTVSLKEDAEWLVSYSCQELATPFECAKYLQSGLYDDDGTVESSDQVDPLLAGGESHEDIDLTLIRGVTLTGVLQLTAGEAPFGGLTFRVNAEETTGSNLEFSQLVEIDEGANSTDFSIVVNTSVTAQYRLRYRCTDSLTPQCDRVTESAFYDAATETMVEESGDATPLANNGMAVADLTLLVESSGLVDSGGLCIPIRASNGAIVTVCM